MFIKTPQKLLSIALAFSALILISLNDVRAEENKGLTSNLLTVGMTFNEVQARIHSHPLEKWTSINGLGPLGETNSVLGKGIDISSSHQIVALTHLADSTYGGDYLLRTDETLLIFKDNVLVSKELSGHRWDKIQPLNTDGTSTLIASEWSGGAHCCYTYFLVALEPTPKVVQTLDLGDSPGSLKPCADRMCLNLIDYTFAYWRGPFATSIYEPVILSLRDGKFQFDFERMRKPYVKISNKKIHKIKQAFLKAGQDENIDLAYRSLGQELLTLIYTGHADKISTLISRIWAQSLTSSVQQPFEDEFIAKLRTSQYWTDLLSLNGGKILGRK